FVKIKMQNPFDLKTDFKIAGYKSKLNFVNTGVPHVVVFVDKVNLIDIAKLGHFIRYHKHFHPQGANVNFVEIVENNKIMLRTYERGVEGETLACGTGATASALLYALNYKVKSPIEVITRSNDILKIYYKSSHNSFNEVYLEGKVVKVFDGYYYDKYK
ncbi:MAG: diaminopimelate epimerase, partial [Candidatus Firestonebacteria bacterium]|nr:diaminopimelate epimerase [Candidatus Firestonebacteria bacterium]